MIIRQMANKISKISWFCFLS
uniref:Akh2 n=1 Tax=Arundo donax TaxID=35708 RepID=A0A0A9EHF6_ARUDO